MDEVRNGPSVSNLNDPSDFIDAERFKDRRYLFSASSSSDDSFLIRGRRLPRTAVLLATCVILLTLCILLLAWCGHLHASLSSDYQLAVQSGCSGPECIRQAAEVMSFMNKSVDPCENFYDFACGNFGKTHPLGLRIKYDLLKVLEDANKRKIEQLLLHRKLYRRDSALRKTRLFYQTCINSLMIESSAIPLIKLIESFGGWTFLNAENTGNTNFHSLFESTREAHGLRLFFSISWIQKDRSVLIELPKIYLNERGEQAFLNGKELLMKRKSLITDALLAIQKEKGGQYNCSGDCIPSLVAERIVDFESELFSLTQEDFGEESEAALSLEELNEVAPVLKWPQLLNRLFGGGIDLNHLSVRVKHFDYVKQLNSLIESTNNTVLIDYIFWKLIEKYLPAMGPRYAAISQELTMNMSGDEPESRHDVCYKLLQQYMSRALRALFVIDHIGLENIPAATDMFRSVKNQLSESFGWMTDRTRKDSLDVLNNLHQAFGYSNWMVDLNKLNEYYSDLNLIGNSFFDNLMEANSFRAKEVKANLLLLVNENPEGDQLWVSGLTSDTHLEFDPFRERLIVPAGVLQIPLFNRHNPTHVNTAMLGSLMLQELALPFFIYHHTYERSSWWDELTAARFDDYRQCISESMQGYTISARRSVSPANRSQGSGDVPSVAARSAEIKLNPDKVMKFIQPNHLAYLMSQKLYDKSIRERGLNDRLPGIQGLTLQQLFYVLFTQVRCQSSHEQLQPVLYTAFQQFPIAHMVNNFVYNTPRFRSAFYCRSIPRQHQGRTCTLDE